LALAGCGKPDPDQRPLRPDQVLDFQVLFSQNCTGCHGEKGRGGPAPLLNNALFLKIVSDTELAGVIRDGRHKTLMPAFGEARVGPARIDLGQLTPAAGKLPVVVKRADSLTSAQIDALVMGIRDWGPQDPSLAPYAGLLRPNFPGDVNRGREVYTMACASCHGDNGQGDRAGPLDDSAFLSLLSEQALRRLVFTGRPDLKRNHDANGKALREPVSMPDYRGPEGKGPVLTPEQIGDVVALLESWKKRGRAGQ
jgi:mono/diheme cytochrome c family protein